MWPSAERGSHVGQHRVSRKKVRLSKAYSDYDDYKARSRIISRRRRRRRFKSMVGGAMLASTYATWDELFQAGMGPRSSRGYGRTVPRCTATGRHGVVRVPDRDSPFREEPVHRVPKSKRDLRGAPTTFKHPIARWSCASRSETGSSSTRPSTAKSLCPVFRTACNGHITSTMTADLSRGFCFDNRPPAQKTMPL